MARSYGGGVGGVPIVVEDGEKARQGYWAQLTKSVPPALLRALGWLTAERSVTVMGENGPLEVPGDKVRTDVLFLRPKSAQDERMWDFVLQLGHRRIQAELLAKSHLVRRKERLVAAQRRLATTREDLAREERAIDSPLQSCRTAASRAADEARRLAQLMRQFAQRGDIARVSATRAELEGILNRLRELRERASDLDERRAELARRVTEAEGDLAVAEAQKREWESWEQPAHLPGLFGFVGAFLTAQQMQVAHRAAEELSKNRLPRVEVADRMEDRLDHDEPMLGR